MKFLAAIPVVAAGAVAVVSRHSKTQKAADMKERNRAFLQADVDRINEKNEKNGHPLRWTLVDTGPHFVAKPNM